MTLDIIALIFIILFFIRGYSKGFIVAVCSVLALILGVLVSLSLSQALASWMTEKGMGGGAWVPVLAWVILFIGVILLVNMVGRLVQKLLEHMMLGLINEIAGGILYALFSILLWSMLLWLGVHTNLITAKAISSSKTYRFLAPVAPWFFQTIGSVMPSVRKALMGIQHFFSSIQAKK